MLDKLRRASRPGRRFGIAAIPPIALVVGLLVTSSLGADKPSGERVATASPPAAETLTPAPPEDLGIAPTAVPSIVASEHGAQLTPVAPLNPFELSGLSQRNASTPASEISVAVERSWPFAWPAYGSITSYMGPEHPNGIDIGLRLDKLSLVLATAGGTVSFAGGSDADAYGLHVVVEHGEGISSLYAHLSEIVVQEGQVVQQGALLGLGGSTGFSTGKHLHFEVHLGSEQIDPFDVLPEQDAAPQPLTLSCADAALVIDQGSTARLDFVNALLDGETLSDVTLQPVSLRPDAPPIETRVEDGRYVVIETHPSTRGAEADDELQLLVTRRSAISEETLTCDVRIHAEQIDTTFYVRVYPDYYFEEPTATPTPTPTATPTRPSVPPTPTYTPTFTASPTPSPTRTPYPSATPIPSPTPRP